MPEQFEKSPAVRSLDNEKASQDQNASRLTSALEDTFPASDPLSMTTSSTAGNAGEPTVLVHVFEPDLRIKAAQEAASSQARHQRVLRELRAMRTEVAHLTQIARHATATPRSRNSVTIVNLPDDVKREIRHHPIAAIGAAAIFGYVWGVSR